MFGIKFIRGEPVAITLAVVGAVNLGLGVVVFSSGLLTLIGIALLAVSILSLPHDAHTLDPEE